MREPSQVLIIGGGIIGLMSAYELVRAGAQVTILDQGQFGQESSWAGGGILSPLYPWRYGAQVHDLARHCVAHYTDLATVLFDATGIDIEVTHSGMLMLTRLHEQQDALTWYRSADNLYGAIPQVLTPQAVKKTLNPNVTVANDALWSEDIAHVRNPRVIQALLVYLQQQGVKLIPQTQITRFVTAQTRITQAIDQHGTVWTADQVVICSGAWSGLLAQTLGMSLDIRPIRGQMLLFKSPANWLPNIVMQDGVYLIPRRDGHILCGSTLEDVGFDKSVNPVSTDMLQRAAYSILPSLQDYPLIKVWTGLRPASPNNQPYICRVPHLDNAWVNAGHFRYGIVFAPASAKRLVVLMFGQEKESCNKT